MCIRNEMNMLAIVKNWKLDEKEMIGKISLILRDQVDGEKKEKNARIVKNIFLYYSSH